MAVTKWSGGITGTEEMPTGIVSPYYTHIYREVPTTALGNGYYDGNTSDVHTTNYASKNGSLVCTVNDVVVSTTRVSSYTFKIDSTNTGQVRVTYSPFTSSSYYGKNKELFPYSPAVERLSPTTREQIQEILDAISAVADFMNTARRPFSIEEYTGHPIDATVNEIQENTPLLQELFNEIQTQILFLYNYAVSSLEVSVISPEYTLYNYEHIDTNMIATYREDINILEIAIGI